VSLLVLHSAEGARTAESLGNYFYRPEIAASSHVGIDDTHMLQYVDYSRSAWTVRSGNPISENAELCGFAAWSRDEWLNNHRGMLDIAGNWLGSRARARGIPLVKLTAEQVGANAWGVIGHAEWTYGKHDGTHTDPGTSFPWDYVMSQAGGWAPPPAPPSHGAPAFPLPRNEYFGLVSGPKQSHGGYYAAERPAIRMIQQALIRQGYVPGVTDPNSRWADGIFERPTFDAVSRFQHARMPGTTFYGQVWWDDWAKLLG
jgi:hypothetical protein